MDGGRERSTGPGEASWHVRDQWNPEEKATGAAEVDVAARWSLAAWSGDGPR